MHKPANAMNLLFDMLSLPDAGMTAQCLDAGAFQTNVCSPA
jgi:hypothetical protein